MADTENKAPATVKSGSENAKTRKFTVIRKFGHPDGSGTCEVGTQVSLTASQTRPLIKLKALEPFVGDDDEDED